MKIIKRHSLNENEVETKIQAAKHAEILGIAARNGFPVLITSEESDEAQVRVLKIALVSTGDLTPAGKVLGTIIDADVGLEKHAFLVE